MSLRKVGEVDLCLEPTQWRRKRNSVVIRPLVSVLTPSLNQGTWLAQNLAVCRKAGLSERRAYRDGWPFDGRFRGHP